MGYHIFCSLETYFSSGITACVRSKNPALPSAALNQAITLGLALLMYSDSEKGMVQTTISGSTSHENPSHVFLSTEEAAQQPCFV